MLHDALILVVPPQGNMTAMSSLEIARITGKNHADLMRDIRNTLEQAEIGLSKFASSYWNAQNKEQPCNLLPRRECDLVVSGYSVKYRLAIIDRWHELEAKQAVPEITAALRAPSTLRSLLLENVEKVLALENTVSELAPKAAAPVVPKRLRRRLLNFQ
jgi:phage regulator Rha-like protein